MEDILKNCIIVKILDFDNCTEIVQENIHVLRKNTQKYLGIKGE